MAKIPPSSSQIALKIKSFLPPVFFPASPGTVPCQTSRLCRWQTGLHDLISLILIYGHGIFPGADTLAHMPEQVIGDHGRYASARQTDSQIYRLSCRHINHHQICAKKSPHFPGPWKAQECPHGAQPQPSPEPRLKSALFQSSAAIKNTKVILIASDGWIPIMESFAP